MSGSAEKASNREIRRAFGDTAVNALDKQALAATRALLVAADAKLRLDTLEPDVRQLRRDLTAAHHRIDLLAARLDQRDADQATFFARLRFLVRGPTPTRP